MPVLFVCFFNVCVDLCEFLILTYIKEGKFELQLKKHAHAVRELRKKSISSRKQKHI